MISKLSASDGTTIKFFLGSAPCGTQPHVTEDEGTDLNFSAYWVPNPRDSYSVIATGDSMIGARIFAGDMLVIDTGREAREGSIVVAWLNGELTVKRLGTIDGATVLIPENPCYAPISLRADDDFRILGVVTSVHRKV
ncbi:MAG: S24 family peptidase [Candidatus Kapabacteria bacterium]|jgi:DNA polymerase V|nr:S24 family peptidase [Candidatus Kapabacteria bacterium]